jgi:hypothetical protein
MKRLALVLLLAAACKEPSHKPAPCAPGLASEVEIRDPEGKLELAVKPSDMPDARDLCDPEAHRIGRAVFHGDLVTLADPSGATVLRLQKESDDDWTATGPKGQLFRVHKSPQETRVLKPDGVPFGSVAPRAGGATLYSPGSAPVGSVAPRDNDQVIAGADGATRHYVVPSKSSIAAGFLGIDGLGLTERVVLYLAASKTAP